MHNFMVHEKIISGKKVNVLPRKSPIKKDDKEKIEIKAEAAEETVAAEVPQEEVKAEEPAQ